MIPAPWPGITTPNWRIWSDAPRKAAIALPTQQVAAQAGPYGVRANCLAPETILTETNQARIPHAQRQAIAQFHPLRRLGTPNDVATAAVFPRLRPGRLDHRRRPRHHRRRHPNLTTTRQPDTGSPGSIGVTAPLSQAAGVREVPLHAQSVRGTVPTRPAGCLERNGPST